VANIEILQLVDRLEELLERSWRLPGSRKVIVGEEAFLNIIDQMRISIPPEVKQAKEILQERERILSQARDEARRMIAEAREDTVRQLDDHTLYRAAQVQAEAIIRRAQQEATHIRAGADEYAEARLKELEEYVTRLQAVIQNGLSTLDSRRPQQAVSASAADQATRPPETMPAGTAPAKRGP